MDSTISFVTRFGLDNPIKISALTNASDKPPCAWRLLFSIISSLYSFTPCLSFEKIPLESNKSKFFIP